MAHLMHIPAFIGLLSLVPLAAPAATILTYEFEGLVTAVTPGGGASGVTTPGLEDVLVGDSFVATWTFDTSVPDSAPLPDGGIYIFAVGNSPSEMFYEFAASAVFFGAGGGSYNGTNALRAPEPIGNSGQAVRVVAENEASRDRYTIAVGSRDTRMFLTFIDPTATALSTDAMILDPAGFSGFASATLLINDQRGDDIEGVINSVRLVPEPSTALLLSIGLVMCSGRRFRGSRTTRVGVS